MNFEKLSKEQQEQIKQAFEICDADGNNNIDLEELKEVLKALGMVSNNSFLFVAIVCGMIFDHCLYPTFFLWYPTYFLSDLFVTYLTNWSTIFLLFANWNISILQQGTDQEARDLMKDIDVDGNGQISFDEFKEAMAGWWLEGN